MKKNFCHSVFRKPALKRFRFFFLARYASAIAVHQNAVVREGVDGVIFAVGRVIAVVNSRIGRQDLAVINLEASCVEMVVICAPKAADLHQNQSLPVVINRCADGPIEISAKRQFPIIGKRGELVPDQIDRGRDHALAARTLVIVIIAMRKRDQVFFAELLFGFGVPKRISAVSRSEEKRNEKWIFMRIKCFCFVIIIAEAECFAVVSAQIEETFGSGNGFGWEHPLTAHRINEKTEPHCPCIAVRAVAGALRMKFARKNLFVCRNVFLKKSSRAKLINIRAFVIDRDRKRQQIAQKLCLVAVSADCRLFSGRISHFEVFLRQILASGDYFFAFLCGKQVIAPIVNLGGNKNEMTSKARLHIIIIYEGVTK